MEQKRTYWEKVAETRWGKYTTEIEREIILEGSKLAGAPGPALEVGCEGGRWSKMLAEDGWKMICTDVSQHSLDICQQKIPEAKCIKVQPDDKIIPAANNSANLLLCIEVAPVVHEDWFIGEAYRVMKRDSIAVIMIWNKTSLRGMFVKIKGFLSFKGKQEEGFYKLSYSTWIKKFKEKGFEIIKEEGFCWFPFSRESNSLFVPVFIKIEKILGLRNLIKFSPWIILLSRKK